MKKQNNIYNYSASKSSNEETSFFLTQGRITTTSFYKRLGFTIVFYVLSYFIFALKWNVILYGFVATIHLYLIPFLLPLFVFIQGAKRMHDINKSGWYFFIPVYNIYLTFLKGSIGPNDFGVDPKPMPEVTFFDELEQNEANIVEANNKTIKKPYAAFLIFVSFLSLFLVYLLISNNNNNQNLRQTDSVVLDTPKKAKTIKNKPKSRKRKKEKFNHNISSDSLDKILKLLQEMEVTGEMTPDSI